MNITPVKDFWMKPERLELKAKEFTFGYTDQSGKKKRYKVEQKGDDLQPFHEIVYKIMDAKKKRALPWPFVAQLKNKVKITNMDDDAVQMELELKAARVARRSFYATCI